jgi:hypothetical protein
VSEGFDTLLIKTATVLYGILCHKTIQCKDVLLSHIHMIEETLLQLVDGTERTVLLKRIIFVCIEYNNIAEAQGLLVVTANEFIVYRIERRTGTQRHHIEFAFLLGCLDTSFYFIRYMTGTFCHRGKDVCMNLLHSGDFRIFYSRLWLVELYRYFIEYDLRTKIESHIFIYI